MNKVYIVNSAGHNFSAAKRYGELVYLSDGPMNRYGTNNIIRQFSEKMKNSSPGDHIVLCSLNVMNSLACAIFAAMHKQVNLLLFKDGSYIERSHVLKGGEEN